MPARRTILTPLATMEQLEAKNPDFEARAVALAEEVAPLDAAERRKKLRDFAWEAFRPDVSCFNAALTFLKDETAVERMRCRYNKWATARSGGSTTYDSSSPQTTKQERRHLLKAEPKTAVSANDVCKKIRRDDKVGSLFLQDDERQKLETMRQLSTEKAQLLNQMHDLIRKPVAIAPLRKENPKTSLETSAEPETLENPITSAVGDHDTSDMSKATVLSPRTHSHDFSRGPSPSPNLNPGISTVQEPHYMTEKPPEWSLPATDTPTRLGVTSSAANAEHETMMSNEADEMKENGLDVSWICVAEAVVEEEDDFIIVR